MVRRNKFILGSRTPAVKEILVQCTKTLQAQCSKKPKCNKMKDLCWASVPLPGHVHNPDLM
jgi:hypothetical protein